MLHTNGKMSAFDSLVTTESLYKDQEPDLPTLDVFNTPNCTIKRPQMKNNNTVISAVCMFSFGVFGNLLSLYVLKRSDTSIRRKLFYRLVAGLTLTDLLGTCATSPVVISVYVNDFNWVGGDDMCKYFTFMMIFAANGTMAIVCLMAIERLVCIRYPYVYHAKLRKKHATIFLLGGWTFAALIASLPLMNFGQIILQYPCTWCFIDYYTDNVTDKGFNIMFASLALIIISVTVTCNVLVLFTLFRTKMRGFSRKNNESFRSSSGYSRRYAECQMAVLLIGITVVFSSCYAPLMMRILLNQTKLLPINRALDLLLIRIASMNQILDPWVYILLRREVVWRFVNTLKKLCLCMICAKNSDNEPPHQELSLYNQRSPSNQIYDNNDNKTCMSFCWHCLCDPPQTRRNLSTMTAAYSESYRRTTIYGRKSSENATRTFARSVAESFVLPNIPLSSGDQDINSNGLSTSSETQIVLQQPTKDTRIMLYSSDTHSNVCRTLLETDEMDENGVV